MLRVSAKISNKDVDIQALAGDPASANVAMPLGAELMRFAESLAQRDGPALGVARQTLLEAAGPEVLVDAAGVAANFQRMVRIADATGIPYDDIGSEMGKQIRKDLNLDPFVSAQHSHPSE